MLQITLPQEVLLPPTLLLLHLAQARLPKPVVHMDFSSPNHETVKPFARVYEWMLSSLKNLKKKITDFAVMAKKLVEEDPRRVIHSFKVALAITLVSLFYYLQPLYNGFGDSAVWAVLTVVVIFDFSVGTTLGKGLNRMMATLLAGFLGFSAHYLANLSGKIGEPILLGIFCFLVATIVTFMRFFPRLKARYDYGLMIFILTFSLVSVSSYRSDEVIKFAEQRLSTIVIGGCITMLVCLFICPVWIGADLHNLIASNIDKLGSFLEGFGGEYFKLSDGKVKGDKSFLQAYKSVLSSKGTEENLANMAAWEPGHGQFRFRHPWKQYLKIGALTRQCAYRVDALNSYLNSNIQASPEIKNNIQHACVKLSSASGKALKELSLGMKKFKRSSSANPYIEQSKAAAQQLKSAFLGDVNLSDVLLAATVASLLIDIVTCTENIAEAVHELATLANFKSADAVVAPENLDVEETASGLPLSDLNASRHDHRRQNANPISSPHEASLSASSAESIGTAKKAADSTNSKPDVTFNTPPRLIIKVTFEIRVLF
ncbi:hypothetical protein Nepgr_000250 [Nepenthes gracilis]|uniref:Aluminum-activated malate transporter 2-like n=1 Tax=Nepenthes gracilis TaxID=150966 RepID=A0AAD3P2Y0_NEPGR|nr:hypothetical protein Nepgr_000250 [Nepenthes gracilis]